ncbi:MAG: hypothetical protein GY847_14870 [Proteobacteria bacterium]|nr:hypothetical protein [Pseudomonadota bacterium]
MKKTCFDTVLLLAAGLLFSSSSTGQTRSVSTSTTTVKTKSGIVLEKAPTNISSPSNLSEAQAGPRPAPLPAGTRAGFIREIRTAVGVSKSIATPPVQISLTPDAPAKNRCYFSIQRGNFYPKIPVATINGTSPGLFYIRFWTRPGKSYFLDISVHSPSSGDWIFNGGVNASVTPVNGHLIAGFVADSDSTLISFKKTQIGRSETIAFYKAELTQVD